MLFIASICLYPIIAAENVTATREYVRLCSTRVGFMLMRIRSGRRLSSPQQYTTWFVSLAEVTELYADLPRGHVLASRSYQESGISNRESCVDLICMHGF